MVVKQPENVVLQTPQGKIRLRKEVAGTAGRVEKFQASQLGLKGPQPSAPGLHLLHGGNFGKFLFEAVQKQGINHLVNIFNAGVVHPSRAAGLRIQSTLKHGAENGGADVGPVKVLAGFVQNQVHNRFVQPGNGHGFIRKQPTVDVRKRGQILVHVGVAVFQLSV